jgi:CDP-diacylglycerol--glycerol-3-phosphate 3-phosphatidyltransferase
MKLNLPNKLSIIRICLIPVFTAVFYIPQIPYRFLISAIIFVVAACTDFLDGYIARKYNMVTNLGKFLDPIADKVLVSTALIVMLTVPTIAPWYTGIAVAIILARELIVSGFRMVAASRGMVLAADKLGKAKTIFQDVAIALLLVSGENFLIVGGYEIFNLVGLVLLAIATVLTIVSGVNYLVKNRAVLKDND